MIILWPHILVGYSLFGYLIRCLDFEVRFLCFKVVQNGRMSFEHKRKRYYSWNESLIIVTI